MAYQFGNEHRVLGENVHTHSKAYTKTVFGQRIQDNPVPVWTAEESNHPFVVLKDPKTGKKIGFNKEIFSYGFMTIAEPGGGKTNLIDILTKGLLNSQQKNDKYIIYDSKGDYYREFGSRIPKKECIVFGAGSEYKDITSYYNLFGDMMPRGMDGKLVYTEDSDEDSLENAEKFYEDMQSESQPIFPSMAEDMVSGLLIYFMRTYWRTNPSMLNNKAFIDFIKRSTDEELKAVFELDYMKDCRKCANHISGKGGQTQGVNSYIGVILRKMFVGPFAKHDPEKEISMREIIETPGRKVVFIEYDLKRGQILEPIYGLMIDRALSYSLGGHHTDRSNVYFILDEMLQLPELKHLGNALNLGRSQGVKVICGLQNVSGLVAKYGEEEANKLLASFQTMIAFHNSDPRTRAFLVERFGKNYTITSTSAQQENITIQREGHTVEDWDILALKQGDAIVGLKYEDPFLFNMPKYQ